MASSYVGVTGFSELDKVKQVADKVKDFPIGQVMFGFTSSNKRLLDPASSGKTSPSLVSLRDLVEAVPRQHLPMIHYYTPNSDTVALEVIALFEYCGLPSRCGLQLNLEWPAPRQLERLVETIPDFAITLQLPKKALEAADDVIVNKLQSLYTGLVKYVLIDPSGGLGLDFDVPRAAELMTKISDNTSIVPGVAGGFSAANVADRIKQINNMSNCGSCQRPRLENYCIDAQGKLRSKYYSSPVYPPDAPPTEYSKLSVEKTIAYITNAFTAFYED